MKKAGMTTVAALVGLLSLTACGDEAQPGGVSGGAEPGPELGGMETDLPDVPNSAPAEAAGTTGTAAGAGMGTGAGATSTTTGPGGAPATPMDSAASPTVPR